MNSRTPENKPQEQPAKDPPPRQDTAAPAPKHATASRMIRRMKAGQPSKLTPQDMSWLQRTVGNQAVQRMLAGQQRAGHGTPDSESGAAARGTGAGEHLVIYIPHKTTNLIRRQQEPESTAGGSDSATTQPATLRNGRFSGIDALQTILEGDTELSRQHNGPAVLAVQQGLADLGYPLPRFLVDGQLGDETHEAIRRFREDHGLPPGTQFDSGAMAALDRAAPAAGQTAGRTIDYERLLADNQLTITVAIGYDEHGIHEQKIEEMRDFLLGEGFVGETTEGVVEVFRRMKSFAYDDPQQQISTTREIEVRVRMVTPSSERPREAFAEGLSQDDITVYTGHARYGTGPDFDHKRSPAENFVIGVGSALHRTGRLRRPPGEDPHWYRGHRQLERILQPRVNDLEQMANEGRFDPQRYRVWFLNGCTTLHYLDELRSPELSGGQDRSNLDIIGTRAPIYSGVANAAVMSFIRSVLTMETLDQLMAGMQGEVDQYVSDVRDQGYSIQDRPNQFFHEGFGDNPTFGVQP